MLINSKFLLSRVLLYIVRILELVLTGAAGGALGADLF